jgi:hypothetical protein
MPANRREANAPKDIRKSQRRTNSGSLAIFAAIPRVSFEGLEHDLDQRRPLREERNQAVMLPSWLFAFLLGFSLCLAVNVTLQLLP